MKFFVSIVLLTVSSWSFLAPAPPIMAKDWDPAYQFVEIETTVHRAGVETSSEIRKSAAGTFRV